MNLKERAKKMKVEIPTIFLIMKDNETPVIAKLCAIITISYALSPIDLIPDFIPVLGYLDDLILIPVFILLTLKFVPEDVYIKNRNQAERLWKNDRPKKWFYAIPVVFIWFLILSLIIKIIWF